MTRASGVSQDPDWIQRKLAQTAFWKGAQGKTNVQTLDLAKFSGSTDQWMVDLNARSSRAGPRPTQTYKKPARRLPKVEGPGAVDAHGVTGC